MDGFKDVAEGSPTAPSSASRDSSAIKAQSREMRPHISRRDAITDYSEWDLMAMVDWIESIGAEDIQRHVRALLTQDPGSRRGARAAATHATSIEVALDHLLDHARRLNRNWQGAVEDVLYARPAKRR